MPAASAASTASRKGSASISSRTCSAPPATAPGRGVPATTGDFDVGLDVFYNVTPALKANFTVNTDFAETEVDERRTNLTRFPLFFEEKREFFLDGANFFEFPGGEESPFFSRRIGLNAGEPQPIVYGAKLIGQVGRQDVGFLQVRTNDIDVSLGNTPLQLNSEDFTVARVRRRFGSQSSIGMIYTRRATDDSIVDPRHTAGADITIATPDFVGGSTLDSGAWYVHTSKPGFINDDGRAATDGRSDSYGWHASVSRDPYRVEMQFKEVQPAYDAAIGFTPRRNFRLWSPEFNWSPRFENHRWIRGVQLGADAEINTNLHNHVIDRNIRMTPLELEFHSGDSIEFQMFKQTENLDEDFEISDGVILPVGSSFDWLRYQIGYDSAEQRKFSGRVEYLVWRLLGRQAQELNLDLTIRPRPGIFFSCRANSTTSTCPAASFTTKLYRVDARTQFSPWISLSNNVQYDTESGELGWQLRFRWIQKPGNDLFFIWTQNWRDEIGPPVRLARPARRAKIVRTIRF